MTPCHLSIRGSHSLAFFFADSSDGEILVVYRGNAPGLDALDIVEMNSLVLDEISFCW
jgi:hypothetical protein